MTDLFVSEEILPSLYSRHPGANARSKHATEISSALPFLAFTSFLVQDVKFFSLLKFPGVKSLT